MTRRLRVLYLLDNLDEDGGAERFATGLAVHLPKDRFEVWMCSTRTSETGAVQTLREAGVSHLGITRQSKTDVYRLSEVVSLLRRERIDILHAHMFGSNAWATVLGTICRTPIVIAEEHTWSYEGQPLRKLIDGYLIGRLATRFIAVSLQDARRMVSIEHVPADKVLMIPSAHVPRPADPDSDIRAELGIGPDTPLIAIVAVLREQKALDVMLDAMPHVLGAVPGAHLLIAGDGPCRNALTAQSERLQITERVHFLGRRQDIEEILSAADVAVICSDFEGTPLVAYECFATHTPLVATAVGGLLEMIEDGVTGVLVEPQNPPVLAEAVAGLLVDPVRRARLAQAAADSPAGIGIDAIAERFADLYEQLAIERGLIAVPPLTIEPS